MPSSLPALMPVCSGSIYNFSQWPQCGNSYSMMEKTQMYISLIVWTNLRSQEPGSELFSKNAQESLGSEPRMITETKLTLGVSQEVFPDSGRVHTIALESRWMLHHEGHQAAEGDPMAYETKETGSNWSFSWKLSLFKGIWGKWKRRGRFHWGGKPYSAKCERERAWEIAQARGCREAQIALGWRDKSFQKPSEGNGWWLVTWPAWRSDKWSTPQNGGYCTNALTFQ